LDCGSPAAALEKGCLLPSARMQTQRTPCQQADMEKAAALLPQSKAVLDQSIKPTIHKSFPHCNTSDSVVRKYESAASIAALHAFL
jgi:hypothetical protein